MAEEKVILVDRQDNQVGPLADVLEFLRERFAVTCRVVPVQISLYDRDLQSWHNLSAAVSSMSSSLAKQKRSTLSPTGPR